LPERTVGSGMHLPPDRNVVGVQVVVVAVHVHIRGREDVPASLGLLIDRYAAVETVGMRLHVPDAEVVNADGVAPVRALADRSNCNEQETGECA
jgi:hypothetical protein